MILGQHESQKTTWTCFFMCPTMRRWKVAIHLLYTWSILIGVDLVHPRTRITSVTLRDREHTFTLTLKQQHGFRVFALTNLFSWVRPLLRTPLQCKNFRPAAMEGKFVVYTILMKCIVKNHINRFDSASIRNIPKKTHMLRKRLIPRVG